MQEVYWLSIVIQLRERWKLLLPICHQTPVSTVDNFTYEKDAIERWLTHLPPLSGLSKIYIKNFLNKNKIVI